jgi:hypothetical protein
MGRIGLIGLGLNLASRFEGLKGITGLLGCYGEEFLL